ncbi:MAG: D-aminoacyl-tRNA deacylase [Halonotius sp.]
MIGIVVSRADAASTHIGEKLREVGAWTAHEDAADADGGGTYYTTDGFELRAFDTIHIELGDPAPAFSDPDALDFLVFVSRHAGETGKLLTAHVTGNFGPAEYGGEAGSFARAAPGAQKAVVDALAAHAPDDYEVGIECTHHGPSECATPSLFVELGSGEAEWQDPDGARAVANAVLDLEGVAADHRPVDDGRPRDGRPRHVVGFGGGHYTPRCERIVTDTAWAVGHIGSDWQLEAMGEPAENRDVIDAAFAASNADLAVVDGEKPELERVIDDLGYRVVSETWLRTVGDRPLGVVEAAESTLSPVADGLRFGEVAVDHNGGVPADAWTVVSLPDELIGAANGIDADATLTAVDESTVAYETTEGATLPAGGALVAEPGDFADLVDRLAELLGSEYASVEQTADGVVCRDTGFDPEKAATLGVPEGPKFGRLAAGETVAVNGREITPDAVESERVERFAVAWPAGLSPADAAEPPRDE